MAAGAGTYSCDIVCGEHYSWVLGVVDEQRACSLHVRQKEQGAEPAV